MYSAETGWMMLSTSAEYTTGALEGEGEAARDCAIVISPEQRVSPRKTASLRARRAVMASQRVLEPVYSAATVVRKIVISCAFDRTRRNNDGRHYSPGRLLLRAGAPQTG